MCLLQAGEKVGRSGAGHKVAVGIMSRWQGDDAGVQTGAFQTLGEETSRGVMRQAVEAGMNGVASIATRQGIPRAHVALAWLANAVGSSGSGNVLIPLPSAVFSGLSLMGGLSVMAGIRRVFKR